MNESSAFWAYSWLAVHAINRMVDRVYQNDAHHPIEENFKTYNNKSQNVDIETDI